MTVYSIYAWEMQTSGAKTIYTVYDGTQHADVEHASCEKKWDEAGRLEFTILPDNDSYDLFNKTNKIVVEVRLKNGFIYWRGFVSRIEMDLRGRKRINCVGALDFLKDSVRASNGEYQYKYGNAEYLIKQMILEYNKLQIHPDKKVTLGTYPTSFRSRNVKFKLAENEYPTYQELALTRAHEYEAMCHVTMTHEGDRNNINFVYSTENYPNKTKTPIMKLSENQFVSATKVIGDADIYSAVLPIAFLPDKGGLYIKDANEYFSLNEANEDDIVKDNDLVNENGLIVEFIDYSDYINNDNDNLQSWKGASINGSAAWRQNELCARFLKDVTERDLERRKQYIENARKCMSARIIDDLVLAVDEFQGVSYSASPQLLSSDDDIEIEIPDDDDITDDEYIDNSDYNGGVAISPEIGETVIYQPGVLVQINLPRMGIDNQILPIAKTKVDLLKPYELDIELGDAWMPKVLKARSISVKWGTTSGSN